MNPIYFLVIVGAVVLFLALFYGILVPRLVRMNHRQKQEKHLQKLEQKKLDAELELQKTQAIFEMEKEREKLKPQFCRYCGARHESNAKTCTNCGASL